MNITTNMQTQNNLTYKGGIKSLNAINPISYYMNRYFKKSARISNKNFEQRNKSQMSALRRTFGYKNC